MFRCDQGGYGIPDQSEKFVRLPVKLWVVAAGDPAVDLRRNLIQVLLTEQPDRVYGFVGAVAGDALDAERGFSISLRTVSFALR